MALLRRRYVEKVGDWEVAAAMVILTMAEQQYGRDVYQKAIRKYGDIQAEQSEEDPR